jgi:hypothetical protein
MNKVDSQSAAQQCPEVILKYVNNSTPEENRLDPQMVTTRSPIVSKLYLDSQGLYKQNDPTNCVLSSVQSAEDYPTTLVKGGRRIQLESANLTYSIPNINERNNTFAFRVGATDYSFTLSERYETSDANIVGDIILEMNTAVGYANFSSIYLGGKRYSIVGGNAFQWLECSATKFNQTYNIPVSTGLNLIHNIGPMFLFYTRYFDFYSTNLTRFTTHPFVSNQGNITTRIGRFQLASNDGFQLSLQDLNRQDSFWNIPYDMSLSAIDIKVQDEFGQQLYLGIPTNEDRQSLMWSLVFHIEY